MSFRFCFCLLPLLLRLFGATSPDPRITVRSPSERRNENAALCLEIGAEIESQNKEIVTVMEWTPMALLRNDQPLIDWLIG